MKRLIHSKSAFSVFIILMISFLLPYPAEPLTMKTEAERYFVFGMEGKISSIGNTGTISSIIAVSEWEGHAKAYANSEGYLAASVSISGGWDEYGFFKASASWSNDYYNYFSFPLSYTMSFFIPQITLQGYDGYNHDPDHHFFETMEASYNVNILNWYSAATMHGCLFFHPLNQIGVNLGGVHYEYGRTFGYTFNAYAGYLELGVVLPGDSFTIEYGIEIAVFGGQRGMTGAVIFGDPLNLTSESAMWFTLDSTPVPEPATLLLIGSGLVGLWGLRRKVRK